MMILCQITTFLCMCQQEALTHTKRQTNGRNSQTYRPFLPLACNEAAAEKSAEKKIIDRNGIIYIEKDGTRYFLNGGKVK